MRNWHLEKKYGLAHNQLVVKKDWLEGWYEQGNEYRIAGDWELAQALTQAIVARRPALRSAGASFVMPNLTVHSRRRLPQRVQRRPVALYQAEI